MESPKYLLAILNSRVLDFYWRRISSPLRGGYYRYFTQFLADLPIRRIDMRIDAERKQHDALVKLATQIIEAKADEVDADTSNLEDQIDTIVYQLYGLTNSEIDMVSEATQIVTAGAGG